MDMHAGNVARVSSSQRAGQVEVQAVYGRHQRRNRATSPGLG
jgi:hypothetical protein